MLLKVIRKVTESDFTLKNHFKGPDHFKRDYFPRLFSFKRHDDREAARPDPQEAVPDNER